MESSCGAACTGKRDPATFHFTGIYSCSWREKKPPRQLSALRGGTTPARQPLPKRVLPVFNFTPSLKERVLWFLLQSIQEGITALKVLIGNLEETGSDLVKLSGPGEASTSIEQKVAACVERYERLQLQTEERGIKIGMTLAQEEEVQTRLDELQTLLEKRKEDFGSLKPISVRPDVIREQIEELKVIWHNSVFKHVTQKVAFVYCAAGILKPFLIGCRNTQPKCNFPIFHCSGTSK